MTPVTSTSPYEAPRVFVSYSHDSDEHRGWVLQLATRLRSDGVDVILDQWDMNLGRNLTHFMESGLTSSERVLVVSSSPYVEKANARRGGTGYESNILSVDMFTGGLHKERIIPVIRNNMSPEVAGLLPTFLGVPLFVDMRVDNEYEEKYDDLLRSIHNVPKSPKPALGANPFQNRSGALYVPPSMSPSRYASPATSGSVKFPYENNSGNYVLGAGDITFTANWSPRGQGSIYVTRDGSGIHSVAVARGVTNVDDIGDVFSYDFSSRVRDPGVGDAVIFRNEKDYFAAVLIDAVTTRAPGLESGELHFRYRIQNDRTSHFGPRPHPSQSSNRD